MLFGPLGLQSQLIGDLKRLAERQYDLIGQILHRRREQGDEQAVIFWGGWGVVFWDLLRLRGQETVSEDKILVRVRRELPHHVDRAEHVAVVVAGLQVLGDVGKRAQVLRVLGCARNVADLVLRDDVLRGRGGSALGEIRMRHTCEEETLACFTGPVLIGSPYWRRR